MQKISEQDEKRKELEEERKRIEQRAEEYDRLIREVKLQQQQQEQQQLLQQQQKQQQQRQRQQQQQKQQQQEATDAVGSATAAAAHGKPVARPPRVKVFSFPKLIQRLWGKDTSGSSGRSGKAKVEGNPLPDLIPGFRRITSSPGNSSEKRASLSSVAGAGAGADRHSPPSHLHNWKKGHSRGSSDEVGYKGMD